MSDHILNIVKVTKRFGGIIALDNVSIEIKKYEKVGLIGPNGAGKTTLFNVISGVYKPDKGKVIFEGTDITGWPSHKIARLGIARTFQIVRPLSNLSVLDNVAVGSLIHEPNINLAREEALKILEIVGLYEKRNILAKDLNLVEKKRLEIARALATKPKLLLLDEVAAGLRPREIDELIDMLFELSHKGLTIIMVEHVMRAVMNFAERVIVLHYGRKIAEGSPKDVAEDPKVIEAYLGPTE